jgi:hypothetical protein
MLKSFKKSPIGTAIGLLVVLILAGITGYILVNTTRVVATYDAQDAVVTECRGSWGYTSAKRAPRRHVYGHSPVATTIGGEKARGNKRLSNKSWCERLIGTQTTVYVNPDPKGKNVYGGFLDFWLFPAIILIIAGAVFGRRPGAYMAGGGFIAGALLIAYEFSAFGVNDKKDSALLTPIGKFDACINKHMADEGISNIRDLQELVCYTPTDLDVLWDMHSLKTLRVVDVELANLDGLATLPNLKSLSLARIPSLSDFSGLSKYPKLQDLLLHDTALESISDIPNLPELSKLRLWSAGSLTTLDGIERFAKLQDIEIDRNGINDISALASMSGLINFMGKSEPFTDISALRDKPILRVARFSDTKVTDFTPLHGSPKLFHSGATGATVPCEQMELLRASLSRKPSLWLPKHCK